MSDDYAQRFEGLEKIFRQTCGEGDLVQKKSMVASLVKLAEGKIDLPHDLIFYYFRIRTLFRVRNLNREIKFKNYQKNCRKMIKTTE